MEEQSKVKMTPRQWIENYWYHYKWATIVGVFLLITFLVGIVQCSTKITPDVFLMYAGPKSLSVDQITALETSAQELLAADFNEDGRKYVEYLEIPSLISDEPTDENGEGVVINSRQAQAFDYSTQVVAGEAQIYFVSAEVYKELKKQDVLTPLSEIYGERPKTAYDETGFELRGLDLYTLPGFCELPSDTIVCLRITRTMGVRDQKLAENQHVWAQNLFEKMISYEAE